MGKSKIGLSDFEYGQVVNELVPEGNFKIPGLTEAKMTVTADTTTLYADDGPYLVIFNGITELKLEPTLMDIGTEHKARLLGVPVGSGIEVYHKALTPPDVAAYFKSQMDDGKYIHFGMLKGKFNFPSFDGKTKEDKVDAVQDSLEGNFVGRGEEQIMYLIGRDDNEDFDLEKFKSAVFPKTEDDIKILQDILNQSTTVDGDGNKVAVTGATLTPDTASVEVGATVQLTGSVVPATASDKQLKYNSSDVTVATVDANGKVTGIKAGTTTVTATTNDGAKTATATVTVKEKTEG